MVVPNQGASSVSVFRNTSSTGVVTSSSFAAKTDFATGTSPFAAALGDIDGDGKLDVAVANNTSGTLSVLRNTATSGSINAGSLAAKVDFTTGTGANTVAMGDFNGDGKIDIAVVNGTANTVSVFRNTSTSGSISSTSLAAKVDFATGTNPRIGAVGDLDGDGMADIAVPNFTGNTISILRNNPIASITGTNTICGPTAVTLLANTTTGGTWSSGNTAVATVNSSGMVTGVATGTVIISYSLPGGRTTDTITVGTAPVITGLFATCVGNTSVLANAITGGSWTSSNPSVASVIPGGITTGVSVGNCYYQLCHQRLHRYVSIQGEPSACHYRWYTFNMPRQQHHTYQCYKRRYLEQQ